MPFIAVKDEGGGEKYRLQCDVCLAFLGGRMILPSKAAEVGRINGWKVGQYDVICPTCQGRKDAS